MLKTTATGYSRLLRRSAAAAALMLPKIALAGALTPLVWNAVTLPASSGAACGNGSPYTFFVNPNPLSSKTIVMFEGGGACWTQADCLGKTGVLSAVNPDGIPTNYMSSLTTQSKYGLVSPMVSRVPLLGTTTETQGWNMVYVAYCTGDVHVGNQVTVLDDADPASPRTQYFRGYVNAKAVAAWLGAHMAHPAQLLVTGFSAGGVGSTANYALLRTAMAPKKSALLADSGPLFPAPRGGDVAQYPSLPLHTQIRSAWGLDGAQGIITQSAAQYPAQFDVGDMGSIAPALGRLFPADRFGYALYQVDDDFSLFSYLKFYPAIAALPADQQFAPVNALWRKDIANMTASIDAAGGNVGYYIPYGRQVNKSHCLTIATFDGTGIVDYAIPSVETFLENLVDAPAGTAGGPVMRVQQVTQQMPPETAWEWRRVNVLGRCPRQWRRPSCGRRHLAPAEEHDMKKLRLRSRQLPLAALVVAALALVLRIEYVDRHPAPDPRLAGMGFSPAPAHASLPADTMPVAVPGVPRDVPPEEWQAMQDALGGTAEGRAQLPRVGAFLGFQHRVERWEALRQSAAGEVQRRALAQGLLDELPTHVHLQEITAFEANALMTGLVQDVVNDPALREQALRDVAARLNAAAPAPDAQMAARMAVYKRQEAVITAQWQAMDPATRDPHWLETQLDAARQGAFDNVP
jgi:hypothetical protein